MNGYNFTDRVRKVLQMAREEAARLHHEYVGTEHILLGLIREGEGVAAAVLANLNVDLEEIRQKVEETVKKGKAAPAAGPDLPYTSRAKLVLELAMSEARELNHSYVGTEHLLLGLLREEKGIAAQVLTDAGADLEQARTETLRLLGTKEFRPSGRRAAPRREGRSVGYNFTNELREVLQAARGEATRLGSNQVDAVHLALAILRAKGGPAVGVLTAVGADAGGLLGNMEARLGGGRAESTETRDMPYTGQAKQVLELAMAEAHDLGHRVIGSEHLLLAVIREGVFEVPNATLSQVRAKVAELGPSRTAPPRSASPRIRSGVRAPWLRAVGGFVFMLSGLEAVRYAPGFFGQAVGWLGLLGGLLLIGFSLMDRRA